MGLCWRRSWLRSAPTATATGIVAGSTAAWSLTWNGSGWAASLGARCAHWWAGSRVRCRGRQRSVAGKNLNDSDLEPSLTLAIGGHVPQPVLSHGARVHRSNNKDEGGHISVGRIRGRDSGIIEGIPLPHIHGLVSPERDNGLEAIVAGVRCGWLSTSLLLLLVLSGGIIPWQAPIAQDGDAIILWGGRGPIVRPSGRGITATPSTRPGVLLGRPPPQLGR